MRQVSAHIRRIEAVEKDLKALRDASASKEDISRVRTEMKKLYEGLHIGSCKFKDFYALCCNLICIPAEFLDLRAHVWGIREYLGFDGQRGIKAQLSNYLEQDLHSLSKKDSSSVRLV